MQTIRMLLVVTILAVLPTHRGMSDDRDTTDTSKEWSSLVQSVQDILHGSSSGQTLVEIAPWAQLAIGDTLLRLSDVVGGRSETHSLLEDSYNAPASIRLKVNDEENAAYLILGTHPEPKRHPQYHTVVFMKDSAGLWLIESWHASH